MKKYSILLLILFLAGCSNSVNLYLNTASQLNLDQQNKSLPVEVRIYQLRDKTAFTQATFRELWLQDSTILDDSLLDKRGVIVKPKSSAKTSIMRKDKCRYIGIMAVFRKPKGNDWRVLYEIPSSTKIFSLTIKLNLRKNKIIVEE